jgi:hypothetical protein
VKEIKQTKFGERIVVQDGEQVFDHLVAVDLEPYVEPST